MGQGQRCPPRTLLWPVRPVLPAVPGLDQPGRWAVWKGPLCSGVVLEAHRGPSACSGQAHGCLELIGRLLAGLSLTSTSPQGDPGYC